MSEPFGRFRRFLRELKRRKVYRVVATYAVVGFVLIQVADLTFVRLGLPSWTVTFVIVLVAVGFPLSLVLAWAFEVTPEGVRRTPEAEPVEEESAPAEAGTRTAYKVLVGLGLLAAAVAGGGYLTGGGGEPAEVNEQTVAVFPFQVSGPETEEWREGMITILGTGLDGAAGLRAIPDQTVLAAWEQADQPAGGPNDPRFLNAARRIGARYAVVGQAAKLGGELRLSADVYETSSGNRLDQVEVQGSPDRFTSLADTLTRQILGVLLEESGEDLPSVDLASLTTSSLPALKSYLRGERHYRGGEYEAARQEFEAAVQQDSAFALAYWRLMDTRFAGPAAGENGAVEALARAHKLSDRLPLRQRRYVSYASTVILERRELTANDSLARWTEVYPDDPRIWYERGVSFLYGRAPGGWSRAEQALQRAVELDPGVTWYRDALVYLSLAMRHDSAVAARRIASYPEGPRKQLYQVASDLAFGSPTSRKLALDRLDTLPLPPSPMQFTLGWSSGLGLDHPTDLDRQAQALQRLAQRSDTDAGEFDNELGENHLLRGQVEEARPYLRRRASGFLSGPLLVGSLTLGYPVPDSLLRAHFNVSGIEEGASLNRLMWAGIYLIERGRGEQLDVVLKRLRGRSATLGAGLTLQTGTTEGAIELLSGYRAWKAGNFREAAKHWTKLEGQPGQARIWRGDLYRELGEWEKAEGWYLAAWRHPVAHERLGQLYEEMGQPEKAAAAYRRFVAAWKNADPELQPRVKAARKRLEELTASGAQQDE